MKYKVESTRYKVRNQIFGLAKNLPGLLTFNFKLSTDKRGFTLIETLVAITVLLIAIGGPLTIAAQALFSSNIAKDRLTAAYLAQEGIEIVRYQRDTNAINASPWLSNLEVCIPTETEDKTCKVGPHPGSGTAPSITSCAGACPVLKFKESTGQYGYTSEPASIFTRTIVIEEVDTKEAVVTSKVEWQAGGRSHEVELRENIYKWR